MTVPADDDRIGTPNEAFTDCDGCGKLFWWDEMLSDDDGVVWFCPKCYGGETPILQPFPAGTPTDAELAAQRDADHARELLAWDHDNESWIGEVQG